MIHVPLLIVGAGPAGLSCAITARELGIPVTLIEALAPGGEISSLVEVAGLFAGSASISGPELAATLLDRALDLGVQLDYAEVAAVSRSSNDTWLVDNRIEADTVVIATGTEPDFDSVGGSRKLYGRGISVCASCDAPLYKEKSVTVIGHGRDAIYEAVQLQKYARRVVALGDWASAAGEHWKVTAPLPDSIEFVQGTEEFAVAKADDGCIATSYQEGVGSSDGVFLALPRTSRHPLIAQADRSTRSLHVNAGMAVETAGSLSGLFAIGDVRSGSSQTIAGALGDGVTAAWNAWKLLTHQEEII